MSVMPSVISLRHQAGVRPTRTRASSGRVRRARATAPDGLRYTSFRLDDGVTFVHLAVLDAEVNPLSSTAAFGRFQADIGERLVAGPDARDGTVVGSYRFDDVTG